MTVAECMSKMSIKEYQVWLHRIYDEPSYQPSLTDQYLIRLAIETRLVRYATLHVPPEFDVDSFLIKPPEKETKLVKRTQDATVINTVAHAAWQSRVRGAKEPDINQWLLSTTSYSDSLETQQD